MSDTDYTGPVLAYTPELLPAYWEQKQKERQALHAALSLFQSKVKHPEKTREGQIQNRKFKYADLSDNMDVVQPLLEECGLSVSQVYEDGAKLYMVTRVMHTGGGIMESRFPLNMEWDNPKAIGAYLQYMRRYTLQAILGLSSSDLDLDETAGDEKELRSRPLSQEQQVELLALAEKNYGENGAKKLSDVCNRLFKVTDLSKIPEKEFGKISSVLITNAPKR